MAKPPGLVQAVFAFLALPGLVAYAVPLAIGLGSPVDTGPALIGGTVVAVSSALLLACVREFYKAGKGTLAPWAPPSRLVTSGPYRWSRNPMYLAVLIILTGWALLFAKAWLAGYATAIGIAFHWRVTAWEEPRALRDFGAEWEAYRAAVRRWL